MRVAIKPEPVPVKVREELNAIIFVDLGIAALRDQFVIGDDAGDVEPAISPAKVEQD